MCWRCGLLGSQPGNRHTLSSRARSTAPLARTDSFGFTAGLVVYDKDPTRPIGDWKEAWEKAKQRAGAILSGKADDEETEPLQFRFHDLRHSAVTRLLEAGIPYPVVASIMGWSAATAIRMSKRYGHIGNRLSAPRPTYSDERKLPPGPSKSPQSRRRSRMHLFSKSMKRNGSSGRTRTYNPPVNSRMLCH